MKTVQLRVMKKLAYAILFCAGLIFPVAIYSSDFTVPHSASPTATRLLEQAVSSLSSGEYQTAEFQASLGASYDPILADFPYIEAVSFAARFAPRKKALPPSSDP